MNIDKLENYEVIRLYSDTIKELKKREIIRTKNVLGELGEYMAIEYYCKKPGLPNLQAAPVGTQNIDAISRAGDRYSIKSTSSKTTGIFTGLEPLDSNKPDKQKFEYIILCKFNDECELQNIYQLTWNVFLKYKHWHSTMKAWNLVISKALLNDTDVMYDKDNQCGKERG